MVGDKNSSCSSWSWILLLQSASFSKIEKSLDHYRGVPWRASTFISTFASSLVVTRNNNSERRRAREDKINKTLRISRWRNRTSRVTCFQEDTRGSLWDSQEHTFASTWHDQHPTGGECRGRRRWGWAPPNIFNGDTHTHTRTEKKRTRIIFHCTACPLPVHRFRNLITLDGPPNLNPAVGVAPLHY